MNSSEEFWTQRYRWPRDTGDYVFLARAVHQVGKHLFGDEWRGDEPTVKAPRPAPRPLDDVMAERVKKRGVAATYTLAELVAERERQKQPPPDPNELTTIRAAIRRWQAVRQQVAEWCASAVLRSATRPYAGGVPADLPAGDWNSEQFWHRFNECRMYPEDPFNLASKRPTSPASYIFVARDDLDRLTAPRLTAGAERRCQRWLENEMRNSPTRRPQPRRDFWRDAQGQFRGLSKRAFDRAWAKAVDATGATAWSAAGAPRKRSD
jgi:hypothetical protein